MSKSSTAFRIVVYNIYICAYVHTTSSKSTNPYVILEHLGSVYELEVIAVQHSVVLHPLVGQNVEANVVVGERFAAIHCLKNIYIRIYEENFEPK